MSIWTAYEVVFRLHAPLHVGWRKVGNLLMARPYVPGRALWGALTLRLTRMATAGPATDSSLYQPYGQWVHEQLAYTYFYPALRKGKDYAEQWAWPDEATFRYRFLGSYTSATLAYPAQSAEEGMLHETEFIAPYTSDTGEPVYLKGYIFEKAGCSLNWKEALCALQFGAERTYGWGDVEVARCSPIPTAIWNGPDDKPIIFDFSDEQICVHVPAEGTLLAHTHPDEHIVGMAEPLVGREWRSNNSKESTRYAGQHIEVCGVLHTPGSTIRQKGCFQIEHYGIWRHLPES